MAVFRLLHVLNIKVLLLEKQDIFSAENSVGSVVKIS
ncbi:hypothetical protein J2X69_003585 [Algoriphagus sp. 4150]|nr:hypothetical protein [Algoriphagus sp. 4150]